MGYDFGEGVGAGSPVLLLVLLLVSVGVLAAIAHVLKGATAQTGRRKTRQRQEQDPLAERRERLRNRLRNRRAAAAAASEADNEEEQREEELQEEDDGNASDNEGEDGDNQQQHGAVLKRRVPKGRKGARYLAKQQAKEERREALRAYQEVLKAQQEKAEQQSEREKKAREARKAAQEEKERQENEEYAAWKGLIETETSGDIESDRAALDARRQEIAAYVVARKRVDIADLAAEFHVRPEEAVRQLKLIEAEEEAKPRGTGLFAAGLLDERGSYVVLTEEEVAAVARNVEDAGRLTLQDIVRIANSHVQAPVPVQEEDEEEEQPGDGGGGGEDAEC